MFDVIGLMQNVAPLISSSNHVNKCVISVHFDMYLWLKLGSGGSVVVRACGRTAAFVSGAND